MMDISAINFNQNQGIAKYLMRAGRLCHGLALQWVVGGFDDLVPLHSSPEHGAPKEIQRNSYLPLRQKNITTFVAKVQKR